VSTPRVVFVDGVPMSGLIAAVDEPKAVVVAFHGGSSTAAYFDCPGHPSLSLLRLGAENGYTMVALDRPGYGSSAPYPDAMERPEQRIDLAYGAIDKILGANSRGAGVFLVGHSAGCELAVRMAVAADERSTETTGARAEQAGIIGLELAGTGVQYHAAMAEIMKSATAMNRPSGLREVLWQPADLYPPDVLSGMTNSSTGALYEVGMTKSWPRQDFPSLAPRVRVPVQFSVAEHERVWRSDTDAIAQIAAMFAASPRFATNEQPGTGHNMSLSLNAAAYHGSVLSFVDECVVAQRNTSETMEAG
jgi:pimeloyl-ACP methyl ester carboxylesterase